MKLINCGLKYLIRVDLLEWKTCKISYIKARSAILQMKWHLSLLQWNTEIKSAYGFIVISTLSHFGGEVNIS